MNDTPETDQLRDLRENHIHRATEGDIWDLCESLERERNEARKIAAELRDLVPWSESEPWNFYWENSQDQSSPRD